MSREIDERVVSMKFDNKQFESNVQTSLTTLDKLKQSLNFTGAAKSFENLGNAAKNVSFAGLSGAVDTVKERFSALEVMAVTALANITNSAVNAGKQMLNSLTLEPVKQGFSEYELKLDSVQTIMASTGESLETVNGYLQELNTYADKTIYSFSDMTASIGKFTNSGVKLEDAVKAIQGISNEAAVSGANAQQASHAMYNFAQALSSGSVKLIDWKSIENANMATVEFKNELMKTAVEMGTLVKVGDEYISTTTNAKDETSGYFTATKNFNDSLNAQWMTSEVLVKTLAKYSDETSELGKKAFAAAQDVKTFSQLMDTLQEAVGSGWATTWEIIFGDFEEAKKLWTSVSNIVGGFIDSQSDARNSLLQEWKDMGGRAALIEAFKNAFKGFKEIIIPIKEAFTNIFPPITAKRLTEISEKLRDITAKFKMSADLSRNLRIGFSELFKSAKNVFEGIKRVAYMLYGALDAIFPKVEITGKKFREIARTVRVFTDKIKSSYEANATLNKILWGLCSVLDIVLRAVGALFKLVKPLIGGVVLLADKILGLTGAVGAWLAKLDAWIQENDIFNKSIQKVQDWIASTAVTIKQFFLTLKEKLHIPGMTEIKETLGKILQTADKKIKAPGLKLINSVLEEIGKKLSYLKQVVHNVFSAIGNAIDTLKKKLSNIHLTDSLSKLWDIAKQVAKGISKVIVNLFKSLGNIDFQKVLTVLNDFALGGMAIAIINFFRNLSKPINDIGEGISEIAGFPKRLTEIFNSIKGAFSNISGALDEVKNTLQAYQTQLKANVLLKIAAAVGILAAAIVALSFIEEEKLSNALGALTLMFADLVGSMAIFIKMSGGIAQGEKASIAMIAMSFSLLILVSAMKKIAAISWEDVAKGLSSFVVMLYFMTESMNKMAGNTGMIKSGIALILVSVALNKVAKALKKVAEMEWEEIAKGLSGLVIALYFIVESMNRIDGGVFNDKKFISIGVSLILVGTALKIVAKALKVMGSMSWEEIAKGLSALVVSLYFITESVDKMGGDKKFISIGVSLILVGTALKIIAKALKNMGAMSWEEIAKGLSALVISLYTITELMNRMPNGGKLIAIGAGLIIVSSALIILSKALKNMGSMEWDEVGKSLLVLAGSLGVLTVALNLMKGTLSGSAALLVAVIALKGLSKVLKTLCGMSIEDIVKSLVAIAGAFTVIGVAALLLKPLVPTILALSAAIALLGLAFASLGIGTVLTSISDAISSLTGMQFGLALQSIALGIIGLIASIVSAVVAFPVTLKLIVKGVLDILQLLIEKIGDIIVAICDVIIKGVPKIKDAVVVIVVSFMEGIKECLPTIIESVAEIVITILDALVKYAPRAIDDFLHLIVIFLDGLAERLPEMIDSMIKLIINLMDGIAARLPELVKSAINLFMTFFASFTIALKEIDPEILTNALEGIGVMTLVMTELAAMAVLTPLAMVGALGMGAVVVELTAVLAAIGALAQIPGLTWIIGEGGNFLQVVGTAIGQFFGGIIGGFMGGVSSSFPKIGKDLSDFMENAKPFIDGAKNIDESAMNGVKALAEVVLTLTAANILDGLTSWFTGGTSLAEFGKELAEFGPEFKKYCDSIGEINGEKVEASANAAKALSEMADNLPKHGGVAGWLSGDSSLSTFAEELKDFAPSLVEYSESVEGLKTDVVENSTNAAKALFAMAENLPKHGGVTGWFKGDNTLTAFAKELKEFGPALMEYAVSVEGLKTDVVENSVNAAKVISEFSEHLPKHGGIDEWFTGSNKLSDFAKELPDFGYNLHLYWLQVDGIEPEIVESSANAAKALAELANITPNTGGMASWFTGEKSLSAFGEQLKAFGAGIQAYANEVTGVKPEVVTSSANAAESLVQLSEKLSNQGGVFSLFTGDKNIGLFGERLVAFGEKFAEYAEKIKEVKPETLSATTSAASSLVELQNNLGEDGGYFSNSTTLADFGEEIKNFGGSFKNFYNNIKEVKPEQLKNVLAEIDKIVELAKGLDKLNTEGMKNFGEGLKAIANGSIKDFINEFNNAKSKIEKAANDMLDNFRTAVDGNKIIFKETFASLTQDCINGIESKGAYFTAKGKDVVDYFMDGVLSRNNDIISSGQKLANGLINGIASKKNNVQSETVTVIIFALSSIKNKYNDFYNAGIYLVDGFILGIKANISKVNDTATEMANTAVNASRKTLDEHSPSKVGYEIGAFFGMGFVNAVSDYSDKSYTAGENIARSAKDGLNNAVKKIADVANAEMDIQPTIRPVVDLSEVRKSADGISNMFNASRSVNLVGIAGSGVNAVNANIQNEVRMNNDNIIKEMRDMRNDISQLSHTVGRMKVVMDTGALVGAIATPINNELGRQSVYYKRGN